MRLSVALTVFRVGLPATRHVVHGSLYPLAFLLDRLDIEPGPRDAFGPDAKEDDPRHVQAAAIGGGAAPAPFTPDAVGLDCRGQQVRAEIGNAREHLRPVGTDLIAASKRPIRMGWLLAVVVLGEQGDDRVDVMPVRRPRKRGDDRCGRIVVSGCHGPSLARSQPARTPAVSLLL